MPSRGSRLAWLGSALTLMGGLAACTSSDSGLSAPGATDHVEHLGVHADALAASNFNGTALAAKTIALTFDDGPGDRTSELSQYLKAQGIPAVFFVNGARIAATALPNPNGITQTANVAAILAQLVADGHLVANHTVTHRDMVTQVHPTGGPKEIQELSETDAAIAAYAPANRLLFRPPYGSWSQAVYDDLKLSAMNKYVGPINWEMGGISNGYPNKAADWACWQGQLYNGAAPANGTGYATTAQCGDAYVKDIDAVGHGIVLMHDPYSWASGSTVDMVKYIVPILKGKGYAFVRADDIPVIAAQLPCDATCVTCTGPNPNQCTACPGGHFLNGGVCSACSACAAGTYTATACTGVADTACTACDASCATCTGPGAASCASCKAGAYLNGAACAACSACGAGTYQVTACTPTTNTACGACDPSCAACTGPSASQCGACPAGFYQAGGVCHACTVCAPGSAQTAACSASADTTCAPCAAGTFAPAGATSCTSCGSCDDGDACTADWCDGVAGCSHAAVPACAGAPGSGAPDGGALNSADASVAPETTGSSDQSGCAIASGASGASGAGGQRGLYAAFAAFAAIARLARRRRRGRAAA